MADKRNVYNDAIKKKSNATMSYVAGKIEEEKSAAVDTLVDDAKDFEIPSDIATFSDLLNNNKKAEQSKRKKKRFKKRLQIAACFILVFAIGSTVLITTVDAFREKAYDLFFSESDDHVSLTPIEVPYDQDGVVPDDWDSFWYPMYLPDGYELTFAEKNGLNTRYSFENSTDEIFIFYGTLDNEFHVDNSEGNPVQVSVNDSTGYLSNVSGQYILVWEQNELIFQLITSLSEEETILIAESISFLKK